MIETYFQQQELFEFDLHTKKSTNAKDAEFFHVCFDSQFLFFVMILILNFYQIRIERICEFSKRQVEN